MGVYFNDSGWTHLYKGLGSYAYPLTFACWYRLKNVTETHPLVTWCINATKSDGNSLSARCDLANDPMWAVTQGSGSSQAVKNGLVSDTTWRHAVAVFDTSSQKVYLDGVIGTNGSLAQTEPATPDLFQIGYYEFHTAHSAEADIAEVSVWKRALSQAEITGLATGKTAAWYSADLYVWHRLVDDYACEQGSGTLTTYGTPAFTTHPTMTEYTGVSSPRPGALDEIITVLR